MPKDKLLLWTRQEPLVVDQLLQDDVCNVRRAMVDKKYAGAGQSFTIAYGFFIREMTARLPPGPGEESPYWLHGTPEATGIAQIPLLCLEVPVEQCLVFSRSRWNRVLNLEYLASSPEEQAAFDREAARQGLIHSSQAVLHPYHPLLKARIQNSWHNLFSTPEPVPCDLQAAVWRLEKVWLKEIL